MSSLDDGNLELRIAICNLAIQHHEIEQLIFHDFADRCKSYRDSLFCIHNYWNRDYWSCSHWTFERVPSTLRREYLDSKYELARLSRLLAISTESAGVNYPAAAQRSPKALLLEERELFWEEWFVEQRRQQKEQQEQRLQRYLFVSGLLILLLLGLKDLKTVSIRRRPPPRNRRRFCASAKNPRPQPSIMSEYLSQLSSGVCRPPRSFSY
jgi:hypothetical protein